MKRISNLNTLRIGIFGTWYSLWYDKEYYNFLIYKDYKLIEYLNSIYYRLRLPTTHFYLNRINQKYYYIQSNIYLSNPNFNRFTKSIKKNKQVFKYISLLEYLFDFNLLIPNNLISNKNLINNILSKINIISFNNNNYYYYFLSYLNFFNLNIINLFFSINSIYIFFLFNNKKKLYINLLNNKFNNKLLINLLKLENKDNLKLNNNLFSIFNNYFNINKNNNKINKKNNNIKYYLINFLSYFINNNFFYYNISIKIKNIINKIINFYLLFIKKLLFSYYFIFIKLNKISYLYKYIYKEINKFFFFIKKNLYINNYYLLKENHILLTNINLNNISYSLNHLYRNSSYNYNLNFLSNKKINVNNKYKQYLNYKFNKFFISSLNNRYGFISFFYIKDFNLLIKENINNNIKINNEIIDMVYFKKINKFNSFTKRIIFFFKKTFFNSFNLFLESTILNYTGFNTFFLPSYYIKKFPSFDTKLLCDYICYNLKKKHKITRVLSRIGQLQNYANNFSSKIYIPLFNELDNYNKGLINKNSVFLNYNNIFNIVFFNKIFNKGITDKYNPISGIRIEFSGPPKKAQMSKTIAYYNIVHDYKLVGKMPTHSIYADIHYHQSYVKLRKSTLGIKVWLFYNTRITNINNINKTIL